MPLCVCLMKCDDASFKVQREPSRQGRLSSNSGPFFLRMSHGIASVMPLFVPAICGHSRLVSLPYHDWFRLSMRRLCQSREY